MDRVVPRVLGRLYCSYFCGTTAMHNWSLQNFSSCCYSPSAAFKLHSIRDQMKWRQLAGSETLRRRLSGFSPGAAPHSHTHRLNGESKLALVWMWAWMLLPLCLRPTITRGPDLGLYPVSAPLSAEIGCIFPTMLKRTRSNCGPTAASWLDGASVI